MVVSLFKIEVDDLLNEYSANGACVDEQPNTAPGFEMDTILHFANPIFAEACQEFLELFPQEVLDRLEGCSGILTTSGAFVRSFEITRVVIYLGLYSVINCLSTAVPRSTNVGPLALRCS